MDMFSQPLTHVFEIHPQGYPWHFSDECHSVFEALKNAFMTALDLTHWILDTPIPVETHTSDYAPTPASISTPNYKLHPWHSTYRPSPLWNSTTRYSKPRLIWSLITGIAILFPDQTLRCQQAHWSDRHPLVSSFGFFFSKLRLP